MTRLCALMSRLSSASTVAWSLAGDGLAPSARSRLGGHGVQRFGDDGVEHRVGPGDALARADRAELELVAGERERATCGSGRPSGAAAAAACARPGRIVPPRIVRRGTPFSIWSRMSDSMSPRKIEMIAGGASLAPSRWSLAAEAIDARSRSAWVSTARITAHRKTRNCEVGVRVVLRIEQVDAGVGRHRPVVVLARAVDARRTASRAAAPAARAGAPPA